MGTVIVYSAPHVAVSSFCLCRAAEMHTGFYGKILAGKGKNYIFMED
jgi:hypothetical protein